jgi:hypothetical protein
MASSLFHGDHCSKRRKNGNCFSGEQPLSITVGKSHSIASSTAARRLIGCLSWNARNHVWQYPAVLPYECNIKSFFVINHLFCWNGTFKQASLWFTTMLRVHGLYKLQGPFWHKRHRGPNQIPTYALDKPKYFHEPPPTRPSTSLVSSAIYMIKSPNFQAIKIKYEGTVFDSSVAFHTWI